MREGKRGAKDKDYELLGDKFHEWVSHNSKSGMNLNKSDDFKNLVMVEMSKMTELYLRLKEYSSKLVAGYEEVFYNSNRDLNYQIMLIISSIKNDDTDDIINKKIRMISKFVDDFASLRVFNFKKVNWNTNKYLLFRLMCKIRNQDCKTVGLNLVMTIKNTDLSFDNIKNFYLYQFSSSYMLHLLARFTDYVNVKMGNVSHFEEYMDRTQKNNTYDIEHILPDDYSSYEDCGFDDEEDFQDYRSLIGNLIILTRDKNRSYQNMKYSSKVKKYLSDNILAQSLNPETYKNNPQFLKIAKKYGFRSITKFTKQSINERADIYTKLAKDIWNPLIIKEIAGSWKDDEEKNFNNKK